MAFLFNNCAVGASASTLSRLSTRLRLSMIISSTSVAAGLLYHESKASCALPELPLGSVFRTSC
jgi:hypothetical protein